MKEDDSGDVVLTSVASTMQPVNGLGEMRGWCSPIHGQA